MQGVAPQGDVQNGDRFAFGNFVCLTKREYFAGLAMEALIVKVVNKEEAFYRTENEIGRLAAAYADALLNALEENA